MGAGEELDLVVAVPPHMAEADDRVGVRDDERVEPRIGVSLVKPSDGVVRGEAGDSLMGKRARVEKRAELDGVGVRRRARLEVLNHDGPFREVRALAAELSEPAERGGAGSMSSDGPPFTRVQRAAPAYQSIHRLLEDELEPVDLVDLRADLDEPGLVDECE